MVYGIRNKRIFCYQGSGFDMKYGIRDQHIFGDQGSEFKLWE